MQIYFSHSYRDVEVNTYFFDALIEQKFELFADQKSPTWCVAKLERISTTCPAFCLSCRGVPPKTARSLILRTSDTN